MKTLVTLVVLATAAFAWLRLEHTQLTRSFNRANELITEQKRIISMLKNQIMTAQKVSSANEQAQAALREQLAEAAMREQQHEQTIKRLLNENEQLRRWYHSGLPDTVRRVHQRPACASAGHCLQRLPESEPLPHARQ